LKFSRSMAVMFKPACHPLEAKDKALVKNWPLPVDGATSIARITPVELLSQ